LKKSLESGLQALVEEKLVRTERNG